MDFPQVLWGSVTKNIEYSTIPGLNIAGDFSKNMHLMLPQAVYFIAMKFF
jgi:hypothetical protein